MFVNKNPSKQVKINIHMQYCPEIFQNLYVEKRNENQVNLAFCCIAKISPTVNTVDQNIKFLSEQRAHLLETGELPSSCYFCIENEKRNVKSQRLKLIELPEHKNQSDISVKLKKLQYNCDNICNLKCVICSSKYSSSWIEDEAKLNDFGIEGDLNTRLKPTKHNQLAYNLDLTHLEEIYFNGGEPFMSNDHIKFLNHVADNCDAKKISIMYSTNSTFPIKDSVLRLWEKFAKVTIMCSIDAIGEAFNYVRFPGNWNSVEKNLFDYQKTGHRVVLMPSIGVHNILYLDDIISWTSENKFILQTPINVFGRLSLLNFPLNRKEQLLEYIHQLPEFEGKIILEQEAKNIANPDLAWIDFLNRLDAIRGNSWKISLSRLYNLL